MHRDLSPGSGNAAPSGFRWCEKDERYVPVQVCRRRAVRMRRCRRCLQHWTRTRLQPALPLPGL